MTTFFCLPTLDFSMRSSQFTIATSPVIINHTNTKIILEKGKSTEKWQCIGGRYEDTVTFRESALAHATEALGKDNTVTLTDAEPILIFDTIDLKGYEEKTLLIHYPASIRDEENIGHAQWWSLEEILLLDAKNETSSPNVRIIAEKLLGTPREQSDTSSYIDPSVRGGRDMQF